MGRILPFLLVITTFLIARQLGTNACVAWLAAVNLVTYFTYMYDKRIAGTQKRRIPETTLLGLALVGGSPGAIIAMRWFRHKTIKRSFQSKMKLVVAAQLGLLILCWIRNFS